MGISDHYHKWYRFMELIESHGCDCILGDVTVNIYSPSSRDRVRKGRSNWKAGVEASRKIYAARTSCRSGHPYNDQNTILEKSGNGLARRCLICRRIRERTYV